MVHDTTLLSMQEAADALDVSMPTFYAILKRGELTPAAQQTIGKQTRRYFHRIDIEVLKRQRAEQTADTV